MRALGALRYGAAWKHGFGCQVRYGALHAVNIVGLDSGHMGLKLYWFGVVAVTCAERNVSLDYLTRLGAWCGPD